MAGLFHYLHSYFAPHLTFLSHGLVNRVLLLCFVMVVSHTLPPVISYWSQVRRLAYCLIASIFRHNQKKSKKHKNIFLYFK